MVDNPVLDKDAAVILRAPVAPWLFGAAGLVVWLIALAAHFGNEAGADELAQWGEPQPSGRMMFAAVTLALLALETLLLPSLASSTLAGERERGTLPLLQVSSLSPARIVAGKVLGLLAAAVPVLCAALPLLALSSIYGGVSLGHALCAVVLLIVHGACLAAAGVGASSLVKRSRTAAPLAMLFSVLPSVLAGIPGVVATVAFAAGEDAGAFAPLVVTGVAAELIVAAACLLLARDQLSPRSAARWPLRRVVVGAVLVALPVVGALALRLLGGGDDYSVSEGVAVAVHLEVGALMVATLLLEVACFADARAADGRSPLRQALLASALAAAGVGVAWLVPPAPPFPLEWAWYARTSLHALPLSSVVVIALYGAFLALSSSASARLLNVRALRVGVVVALALALFFAPLVLHEVRYVLPFGSWPLGFTNPVVVLAREGDVSAAACVAFFAVANALLALLSRRRR